MASTPTPATRRAFTVFLCKRCTAGPALAVLDELRATIRRCDHGVLVSTACLLGALNCAPRVRGPGVMVMLQACSVDRVPSGAPHWIGPINDQSDICAVCDWLARGEWDRRALPDRLRAELRWIDRARRN